MGETAEKKMKKPNGLLSLLWERVLFWFPQNLEYHVAVGWDVCAATIQIMNWHKTHFRWAGGGGKHSNSKWQGINYFAGPLTSLLCL